MKITDTLGAIIGYVPIVLVSGGDSAPITIIVTPENAAEALEASIDANARALGRIAGSGGAWIDLAAAPIPLATYMGGTVSFEIIARAEVITGRVHANLFVGGSRGTPAGWTA